MFNNFWETGMGRQISNGMVLVKSLTNRSNAGRPRGRKNGVKSRKFFMQTFFTK